MTRLIIETDDTWTRDKIKFAIDTEVHVLRKTAERVQKKILNFERQFGPLDREKLYGLVEDMELVEWEGEVETLKRLTLRLKSLEEINFEYR